MAEGVGLGVIQNPEDGKHYVVMQVDSGNISVAITLTGEDTYETVIDALVDGLIQVKADMRRAKSGLVLAKGVDNASLRQPEGGQQSRPSRPRQSRPRPAKGSPVRS